MSATTTPKTKICTRCGKRRKVELFYRDRSTKDGYSPWDKQCEAAYNKEYRERKRAEKEVTE